MSDCQDGSDHGVFARLFDSAGGTLGDEFQVNAYTTGARDQPRVAMSDSGGFVVVWPRYMWDGSTGVLARRFD